MLRATLHREIVTETLLQLLQLTAITDAQTARIKVLSIACTSLEIEDVDLINYYVKKFVLLEYFDLSVNLSLDTGAIHRIVASFAGNSARLPLFLLSFVFFFALIVFHRERRRQPCTLAQHQWYSYREVAR